MNMKPHQMCVLNASHISGPNEMVKCPIYSLRFFNDKYNDIYQWLLTMRCLVDFNEVTNLAIFLVQTKHTDILESASLHGMLHASS